VRRASFDDATVGDLMHHSVTCCEPDAPLAVVAQQMAAHRIHAVVVADPDDPGHPVLGVVSDLDLAHALACAATDATARDVARTEAPAVAPGAPLLEAALLMDKHRIAHLIVVDGGRPVGILSTLDLARALARDAPAP
jgi:CBS domain-containing protein